MVSVSRQICNMRINKNTAEKKKKKKLSKNLYYTVHNAICIYVVNEMKNENK